MRRLIKFALVLTLFLPLLSWADTTSSSFEAGKDYAVIPPGSSSQPLPKNKIQVIEFFSYGCPWCFKFEPVLEKWLASKPKNVVFERVPVIFEPGWDVLAKTYYASEMLGVQDKMMPVIFNALQVQQVDFSNPNNIAQLFAKEGVKSTDFLSMYNFTPGMAAQINRGNSLMQDYNVMEIPTIVVNGKYRTNSAMNNADFNRMIQVVNYLIAKEQLKAS